MISALESILNFLQMIGQFVISLCRGLEQVLHMIPQAFSMLTISIGVLPSFLLAFAAVAITLSIVYTILGR